SKSIIANTREIANTTLPHKLVKYCNPTKPIKLLDLRPSGLLKHTTALRKITRQLLNYPTVPFLQIEIDAFNNSITAINAEFKIDISLITTSNICSWAQIGKQNLKLVKKLSRFTRFKP